jgi:hypothetical protein
VRHHDGYSFSFLAAILILLPPYLEEIILTYKRLTYCLSFVGLATTSSDLVEDYNMSLSGRICVTVASLVLPILINLVDIRVSLSSLESKNKGLIHSLRFSAKWSYLWVA